MRAVVTGAAGFVGSTLCEHLLASGDAVTGVDCFTDYYDRGRKERNLEVLRQTAGFTLVEADLAEMPLDGLLAGADAVFHLAGQPGVRGSWGDNFETYLRNNVRVTQRLLEAARASRPATFVYASSSSVYGDAQTLPTAEAVRPRPHSPYGVTKLAAEHLCELYRTNHGVPTASLRLFTVYGPRQRPDMAFSRLVHAGLTGATFELFGDGTQTRDFTFVDDVVQVMRVAAVKQWQGVANIGGGERTSMIEVIAAVEALCGPLAIVRRPPSDGDVGHTGADTTLARRELGFRPGVGVREGLVSMVLSETANLAVSPAAGPAEDL